MVNYIGEALVIMIGCFAAAWMIAFVVKVVFKELDDYRTKRTKKFWDEAEKLVKNIEPELKTLLTKETELIDMKKRIKTEMFQTNDKPDWLK